METVKEFINRTKGKSYDVDGWYGAQCWDYFAYFVNNHKIPVSTYCGLTGYAGDLWYQRDKYGYSRYFNYVYKVEDLQDGDWVFMPKHVALYYDGKQWGQNQGGYGVTAKDLNKANFIGALRPKEWVKGRKGVARFFVKALAGDYVTTASVNIRLGGGTDYDKIKTLKKGTKVSMYGYYDIDMSRKVWYYVVAGDVTGFIHSDYLARTGNGKA